MGRRQDVTVAGKGDAGIPAPLPLGLRRLVSALAWPWAAFTEIVYAVILFGAFVHDIGRFELPLTRRHFLQGFAIERSPLALHVRGAAWDSLFTTLEVAAISSPITAFVGILFAWLFSRTSFRGKRTLEFVTLITFAITGTVVAVAYVTAFNVPPLEITGTGLILVLCFVFRNMPVGMRGGLAALAQIDRSLDQASATMGADAATTLRRVVLPLLRPAIVTALACPSVQEMIAVPAMIRLIFAPQNLGQHAHCRPGRGERDQPRDRLLLRVDRAHARCHPGQRPRGSRGLRKCSARSGLLASAIASQARCQVGSSNAWRWRGGSCFARPCCCSTSRCRTSMRACVGACARTFATCSAGLA